jgi:hypothetical protein
MKNKPRFISGFFRVQLQFKTERTDRQKIEAELSELKQNSASAATLSKKLTSDATTIFTQL